MTAAPFFAPPGHEPARLRRCVVEAAWLGLACLANLAIGACHSAHAGGGTLYRCAGHSVFFTTDAATANARGCRAMRGAPLIYRPMADATGGFAPAGAAQLPGRRRAVSASAGVAVPAPGKSQSSAHSAAYVSRDEQAHRDRDRRRILEEELSHEQNKLSALTETLTRARAQAPAAEVAVLSQSSLRSESNVEALRRELSRVSR
jgi:hypothetical protein